MLNPSKKKTGAAKAAAEPDSASQQRRQARPQSQSGKKRLMVDDLDMSDIEDDLVGEPEVER